MSPGRTCDYRTYVNNSVSTPVYTSVNSTNVTSNVTVEVDYVYYDTYLGVYKYLIDSNSYEFVREVEENFTGNITTTIDSNTEIYVQMHAFHALSCAGFYVRVSESSSSSNDYSGSGTTDDSDSSAVVGITIAIIVHVCIFGC